MLPSGEILGEREDLSHGEGASADGVGLGSRHSRADASEGSTQARRNFGHLRVGVDMPSLGLVMSSEMLNDLLEDGTG